MLGSEDDRVWTLPPPGSPPFAALWLRLWRLLSGGRAPRGMVIHGSLLLHQTRIRSLPAQLEVTGDLDLRHCERLQSLGSELRVGGDLLVGGGLNPPRWLQRIAATQPDLRLSRERSCPLPVLPDGLRVDGALVLRHCALLRSWPRDLRVDGDVVLHQCPGLEGVPLPAAAQLGGELRQTQRRARGRPSRGRRELGRDSVRSGPIDEEAWRQALEVLQRVADDPEAAPDAATLAPLLARARRALARQRRRVGRGRPPTAMPERGAGATDAPRLSERLSEPGVERARCYICGGPPRGPIDAAYPWHCGDCAQRERQKRAQHCDLTGRVALVTGGRVKIGFQTALRLLRDGARVIVTTRFAQHALRCYAAERDFEVWRERLRIYRLDFRFIPDVLTFTEHLCREEAALDLLVNNAAQTVARPSAFYAEELALEDKTVGGQLEGGGSPIAELRTRLWQGQERSALALMDGRATPQPLVGTAQEEQNSWTLRLDEVPPAELLEVLLVNSAAPYYLCGGLEPLLRRSSFADRYIVNVNGADGTFGRPRKTITHPHVNMSKAALNMLTRTAARDYAARGIYMSSVDVGWVSFEGPEAHKQRLGDAGLVPPLDAADAAARVCDPIVRGIRDGDRRWGLLFRHYEASDW